MPVPFTRPAVAVALALAVGLVALPACKKTKPTVPDSSAPAPTPAPGPGATLPGLTGGDSFGAPPQTPVFGAQNPRVAAARVAAVNNMKEIGIALHAYESVYGALPAGYADATGKAGLSWRVAILPFLEQDNLFKMFKLDEPWDSEHNKKLIDKMPKQFAPGGQDTRGYTFARGFTGPNTWLPPQRRPGTPGQPLAGAKLSDDFPDGTANTILVADAGDAVIWTKPDEMLFAPPAVPKLGGVFQSWIVVGMADGSARVVGKNVSPKTLADAIQTNDGRIVDLDN